MSEITGEAAAPRRRSFLAFLPLVIFAGLVVVFLIGLRGDPQKLPSALIGKPAPQVALPPVEGVDRPGLTTAALQGQVTLVNVFASWCIPCHEEHPFLMELAKDSRFRLAGINQKDQPENARRFLGRYGNPFAAVGADANGRASIEWGVYGVPETFVVDRAGRITFKLVGPITPQNLETQLKPALERAAAN